ncbi:MAG TPA: SHOCT domain-containing protein [Chloroflexota bacterium]|nr:SHOCT domain-containing protein [Chloroflexota bacterium]
MAWQGGYGAAWAHGGPWLFAGPLFGLLWLAVIAVGVILLVRYLRERDDRGGGHARAILDERYARGELSTDEYRERLQHLG